MKDILRSLGSEINELEESIIEINTEKILKCEAEFDLVSKMRASFLVMGPLLARVGRAKVNQRYILLVY